MARQALWRGVVAALVTICAGGPMMRAAAAETVTAASIERGAVTNLPVPRYVSLKSGEGNVRRGPSLTHRVDWVFHQKDMPLQITAEFGHWRRVQDWDGAGGWVHYSLLSGVRTVIVQQDLTPLRETPAAQARPLAYAEAGVIARLGECLPDWCKISADGNRGWAMKSSLWGVEPGELRD